jgi:hypothetical protein
MIGRGMIFLSSKKDNTLKIPIKLDLGKVFTLKENLAQIRVRLNSIFSGYPSCRASLSNMAAWIMG